MRMHIHIFATRARIFDQYGLVIVHWQSDKKRGERGFIGERLRENNGMRQRQRCRSQERERTSLSCPLPAQTTKRHKFRDLIPDSLQDWIPGIGSNTQLWVIESVTSCGTLTSYLETLADEEILGESGLLFVVEGCDNVRFVPRYDSVGAKASMFSNAGDVSFAFVRSHVVEVLFHPSFE